MNVFWGKPNKNPSAQNKTRRKNGFAVAGAFRALREKKVLLNNG
jgi:hypothetical protein